MGDFMGFSPLTTKVEALSHDVRIKKLLTELNDPGAAPLIRLHNEILSFCETMALSGEDEAVRDGIVKEIESICRALWGDKVQVHMFGSQATGTANKFSDVDLTVLGCDCPADDTTAALVAIADIIKERDLASYLEIIPNAKVPIIKMDHKATGISLDICCNEATGIEAASLVSTFSKDYPPFKYLTMVLKCFLARRHLHETYSGGIGSFVLAAMVISFIQQRQRVHDTITQQSWNLGSLLMDFFDLYGCTLNYNKVMLSLRDGGSYVKKPAPGHNQPMAPVLSIESPMDPSAPSIGENSFMMPKIRRAFEQSLQVLTIKLAANEESASLLSSIL